MIGIIIQARMGSSRLPGKILMDFCGKTLIERVIDRIKESSFEGRVIIATSVLEKDDVVEELCNRIGVDCYRGDELNVLKRYYECAEENDLDDIVRMTGDNPFPDIHELLRLIDYHKKNKMEFSENFSVLPVGVGMEILSFGALQQSMMNATLPKHFEHADEYVLDNLEKFRHGTLDVSDSKRFPDIRLTVDTRDDYKKALYILRSSGGIIISTEKAIELCKEYEGMNSDHENSCNRCTL